MPTPIDPAKCVEIMDNFSAFAELQAEKILSKAPDNLTEEKSDELDREFASAMIAHMRETLAQYGE